MTPDQVEMLKNIVTSVGSTAYQAALVRCTIGAYAEMAVGAVLLLIAAVAGLRVLWDMKNGAGFDAACFLMVSTTILGTVLLVVGYANSKSIEWLAIRAVAGLVTGK